MFKIKRFYFVMFVLMLASSMQINAISGVSYTNNTHTLRIDSIAHEHYNVSSNYELVVGWITEPPRVGVANNVSIEVNMFATNGSVMPVNNAENNLTGIITKDTFSTTQQLLIPSKDTPGLYTIPFKPTKTGVYTLHINGTLESDHISKDVELDQVSSTTTNLILYLIIPVSIITIVGVAFIVISKKRRKSE